MADYVGDIACDALANFTSTSATGTGYVGIDTEPFPGHLEGTGSLITDVGDGAGVAYAEKTLTTAIASTKNFRLQFNVWWAKSGLPEDAPPFEALDNAGYIKVVQLLETASGREITLRVMTTPSATYGKQWQIITNASGSTVTKTFDPGWEKATWRQIQIYGYVHDTAGWLQVWQGGTKWVEWTGIDTYPGASWNSIRVGIAYRNVTSDQIALAWDRIEVDDTASPAPPGQRVRGKVNSCLAGVGSRGGIITGVQAMLEYEKIRRAA